MSPAEHELWLRVLSRARAVAPGISSALLKAFQAIRDSLTESEIVELLKGERVEELLRIALPDEVFVAAFQPVRDEIRGGVVSGVKYFLNGIPRTAATRSISFAFDSLSPNVITAIRTLETRVMTTLETDARETLRAFVENGFRDGVGPRVVARQVRGVIGLAPNQLKEIENYREALEGSSDRDPLDYELRDKRFDSTVEKGYLSPEKIDKLVDLYRKRKIAWNTETVARTAALDAQKLAQKVAWEQAVSQGIVSRDQLRKRWVGVMDSRERPEHVEMEKQVVGFDEAYSNGEYIPGESTYNCRCISAYFVAPPE